MLETLLALLKFDLPAPEILLEEDGDIGLDWNDLAVSIHPSGSVAWALVEPREHGSDLERLKAILKEREAL